MIQHIAQNSWPAWAQVLLMLIAVLVVVTLSLWLYLGVAMAAGCSPMMMGGMGGGMRMPDLPQMR
jgi:hypothetical protein